MDTLTYRNINFDITNRFKYSNSIVRANNNNRVDREYVLSDSVYFENLQYSQRMYSNLESTIFRNQNNQKD